MTATVIVLAAASSSSIGSQDGLDYTQWRGSLRDGSASDFVAPQPWPKVLTRRWTLTVGEGYATPLVIGPTVYTFTRQDGREVVRAIDAETGKEIWRTDYEAAYSPGQPAAKHGAGPKATPLFHEGKLFTVGVTGVVSAFDVRTHSRLWQTPPPNEAPFFNAASSPLGEQGVVITHPGNYGPLTAFDVTTGAVKWTAGGDGFFASPVAATFDGVRQVVTATQDSIIGVSLNGQVLWRHVWEGGGGSTTPVIHNGMVIVSARDKGIAAIRPRLKGTAWDVESVWRSRDVWMYVSNPVVLDNVLFGLSERNRGQFFALDTADGKVLWLGEPRQAENTAVVKGGGLLFLLKDDGELVIAKPTRTLFESIARYTVAESATWAQPAISGNRMFVKDTTSISLWTFD
jgi:outer membrane protein assembly factor BamB